MLIFKTTPRNFFFAVVLSVFCSLTLLVGCKPQDEVVTSSPSSLIYTSADTIRFDTVITNLWSPSRRLRIFNPNSQAVTINSIALGPNSPFNVQMYVNGRPGSLQENVMLRGGDSLLIILSVNVNSTAAAKPFLLLDSITIRTQGIAQPKRVLLEAWGQNAIVFDGDSVNNNVSTIWADQDRPYYIKNSFLIKKGGQLTIKEGVRVFNYANSNIIVLGKLLVQGTRSKPVVFTGTRQEARYDLQPDQWGAIAFLESSAGNRIEYAIIKNGLRGVQVGVPNTADSPDLYISNSTIRAFTDWGICSFGGKVTATNNIILDCGISPVGLYQGGTYNLLHNTIGYSNQFGFKRDNPALAVTDFYEYAERQVAFGTIKLDCRNNLVFGNRSSEFTTAIARASNPHQLVVTGNAIRTDTNVTQLRQALNTVLDFRFRFLDVTNGDFSYDSTLTPTGKASDLLSAQDNPLQTYPELRQDYYGKNRNWTAPDPGAINAKTKGK